MQNDYDVDIYSNDVEWKKFADKVGICSVNRSGVFVKEYTEDIRDMFREAHQKHGLSGEYLEQYMEHQIDCLKIIDMVAQDKEARYKKFLELKAEFESKE